MGEYIIYYKGRITAYVCDNRLLVKPVEAAKKYIPDGTLEPPYAGAKDMLLVEGNTLLIRNPARNKDKPYQPPALTDADKAAIDSQLMGRGLHCEFGFEPINLNTGNFYLEQEDSSVPDYGEALSITRSYNSRGAEAAGAFGRGFSFA